jgi:dihydrofolate reductase
VERNGAGDVSEVDMNSTAARPLIAGMQVTLDGFAWTPDGGTEWVDSWADALALLPPVDAFILGAGMFHGYQGFWKAIADAPDVAAEMLGREPYPRERDYAYRAAETEHLVVSTTLSEVTWPPTARIVRDLSQVAEFRQQPGDAGYVVGGPGLVVNLINAGLLDELRLVVHPVAVGAGRSLLEGVAAPLSLQLLASTPTAAGRLHVCYRILRQSAGE